MTSQPKISHQLVIHVDANFPITFESRKAFVDYLTEQRGQGDWNKFEHLPLLKVVDKVDGEFIAISNIGKIPYVAATKQEYVMKNPKSKRPLIIIKK